MVFKGGEANKVFALIFESGHAVTDDFLGIGDSLPYDASYALQLGFLLRRDALEVLVDDGHAAASFRGLA